MPPVNRRVVQALESMGVAHNNAVCAVYNAGGGISSALDWLAEHDADASQPLLLPEVGLL